MIVWLRLAGCKFLLVGCIFCSPDWKEASEQILNVEELYSIESLDVGVSS
jgi:hypothetical protein